VESSGKNEAGKPSASKGLVVLALLTVLTQVPLTRSCEVPGFGKWVRGDFVMPPDIGRIATIEDLSPYLKDRDEFRRMAAVRRLYEINGSEAIDMLCRLYCTGYSNDGPPVFPLANLEIIRILGKLGTQEAKMRLAEILEASIDEIRRERIEPVMHALLSTLEPWASDDAVYLKSTGIIHLAQVKARIPLPVYVKAYELYILNYLSKEFKQATALEAVLYLVGLARKAAGVGQQAKNGEQLAIGLAARNLLYRQDPAVLMEAEVTVRKRMEENVGKDGRCEGYNDLLEAYCLLRDARTKETQVLTKKSLELALSRSRVNR